MKQNVVLFSSLVAALSLVGCNVSSSLSSSAPATTSSVSSVSSSSSVSSVSSTVQPIVVDFLSWGNGAAGTNNLLRARAAAFNAARTDVQINVMDWPGGNYNEYLATLAAAGELPDVMMVNSVPEAAVLGYAADISAQTSADPEWANVPVALRDAITYDDYVLGVPSGLFYLGFLANFDLIDDYVNLPSGKTGRQTFSADGTGYTLQQWFNAIGEIKDVAGVTDGSGVIGTDGPGEWINWMPSVLDSANEIGHYLWNNGQFDFLNSAVLATVSAAAANRDAKNFYSSYTGNTTDSEGVVIPGEKQTIFGLDGWDGQVYINGQMGFKWGGTWDGWMMGAIGNSFNYDFIPLPGNRIVGVSDFYVVSPGSEDLGASYEVAKWLTFGSAGLDAATLLAAQNNWALDGLPLNTTKQNQWWNSTGTAFPGAKKIYEKAALGEIKVLVEANKYLPGFPQARWNFNTGIAANISRPGAAEGATLSIGDFMYDAMQGTISYQAYMTPTLAATLNSILTTAKQDVIDALEGE